MSCFICPVCKSELEKVEKVYVCSEHHSFDISKYGYVNLLMSNQSSLKRHGDDKLMVASRRSFLEKGFYEKLCNQICQTVESCVAPGSVVADIGCGEGYYSKAIFENADCRFFGIDISKDALKYAAKSVKGADFAVASAFNLPFDAESVDCLLNVFAPSAYEEFHRVLKDDGVLIKAVPLEEHLWGLKCALYDKPYKNKPELKNDDLFRLVSVKEIRYELELDNTEDILNLFRMTPYYYKTGSDDANKINKMTKLSTVVHFGVEVYRKR